MRVVLKPGGKALIAVAVLLIGGVTAMKLKRPGASMAAAAGDVFRIGALTSDPNSTTWELVTEKPAAATMGMVNVADAPGANGPHTLHVEVTAVDPVKYWKAQLIKQVPDGIPADRSLTVRFWARSKTSTPVYVAFEEGKAPHTAEMTELVTLTPDWKEYSLPFRTVLDHTSTHANFNVKAGLALGEFEIAQMRVSD
jgi:hypothetical protein